MTTTDFAAIIKDRVTMGDVLSHFGITNKERGRIPCPLHNGHDNNFSFKPTHFHCFVCGASGTVIDFTMAYFGIPFSEAVKRLNSEFSLGLPIDREPTREERERAVQEAQKRHRKRLEYELEKSILTQRYNARMDEYARLDRMKTDNEPQNPFDPLSDEFIYAVTHIDEAAERLDHAAADLYAFEAKSKRR